MHTSSDILHRLRHERRHMRGIVEAERTHPESLLGELCGRVELAVRNVADDFIQSRKVIAHVAEHVLLHGLR